MFKCGLKVSTKAIWLTVKKKIVISIKLEFINTQLSGRNSKQRLYKDRYVEKTMNKDKHIFTHGISKVK